RTHCDAIIAAQHDLSAAAFNFENIQTIFGRNGFHHKLRSLLRQQPFNHTSTSRRCRRKLGSPAPVGKEPQKKENRGHADVHKSVFRSFPSPIIFTSTRFRRFPSNSP